PDRWNLLCKEAILPFVEEHGTKLCQKYIVHFGSMRGHYLGLSCRLPWKERIAFLQLFHEYFSNFLSKNPSASTPAPAPSGLYMDFPPNVICHSVHNFMPTFHAPLDEDYAKLWQDSSRCLLKAIKREH